MVKGNKRGLERMALPGGPGDLSLLVQALNDRQEDGRLRELVKNLNEISYGQIDREIAAKVDSVFREIRLSPCLYERRGSLSIAWVAREGHTIFQEEAALVANLAALGLLVRIHQCSRCGRWFAAQRERARYSFKRPCSDKCRGAIHRKKPEVKKRRARYMRDYYRANFKRDR